MLKVQNTYVLVAKSEYGTYDELVEYQIFTRNDVERLGFSVDPKSEENVIAMTLENWGKENRKVKKYK